MGDDAPKILVVDDEPIHVRFAQAVLSPIGWDVKDAPDGAGGVAAILAGGHALVLMDIQMPALNGIDATIQVRTAGKPASTVPILAFTALRQPDMIARFRAAGMDGYLAKPCTPDALRAAVAPWWPEDVAHPGDRLAEIFGAAEIAGLLGSFRDHLAEALAMLDNEEGRAERAHRMGGLAGTLGFQDVSTSWLALSEGDVAALEPSRIAARKALVLLDREARRPSGPRTPA
jgi:CheY-like chemotaxis protein